MNLTTGDLTKIAVVIIFAIVLASLDDPRAWNWVKAQWSNTVGAWFAKRRAVLHARISEPDEHSKGIMVARRDINTGWWT